MKNLNVLFTILCAFLSSPLPQSNAQAKDLDCAHTLIDQDSFSIANAHKILPKERRYTQGLVYHNGKLLESVGLYGGSALYEYELETGKQRLVHALPGFLFAEGLAFLDGLFYQLTWKARRAYIYTDEQIASGELLNSSDLERRTYTGEGWGLTDYEGKLIKSDGSDTLEFLNPYTLQRISSLEVKSPNLELGKVNEMERIGDKIFANIYVAQEIAQIDPATGCVEKLFNLRELFDFAFPNCDKCGELESDTVANGIAYNEGESELYLTGKNWPYIFVFKL